MLRYETLILSVPEITTDEISGLQAALEKTAAQFSAEIISFERWGKYRLSYPVRKHEYGVYFLTRFEVAEDKKDELLSAVNTLFSVKYNELVMRHLTSALEAGASLEYQRPESLEEAPAREVESRDGRSFGRGRRPYAREENRSEDMSEDMSDESSVEA